MVQKLLSSVPGGMQLNYGLQIASGAHSQATADRRVPGLLTFLSKINEIRPLSNCSVLEISTGWNAINAVLFSILGAKDIVATDYTRHLRLAHMKRVVIAAKRHSEQIASIRKVSADSIQQECDQLLSFESEEEFLSSARITYLAPSDACRLDFSNERFDVVFSCRVLAHFPEQQLPRLAEETKRLLKPGGQAAHMIGLQDPYFKLRSGCRVAFLKHSDRVWNLLTSQLQSNNRLRASQHTRFYTDLGAWAVYVDARFKPEDIERLKKMSVDSKFAGLTLEDLATHSCDVILQFG